MLRLARLGFADAERADTLLGPAPDGLGLWAGGDPADGGAAAIVSALGRAADPDLALVALSRIAEPDLLAALRADPVLRRRLVAVLGASAALGDHLAANPADWRLLTGPPGLPDLLRVVGADPADPPTGTRGSPAAGTGEDVVADLRLAYRRHLLVLAARDLAGEIGVDEVGATLAALADRTLSAGLAVALAGLRPDAAAARLAVIGMGKCGGRELNYVSDVDVVFVAEGDLEVATRLASDMVRVCGRVAWPVDAALRPEGKLGPLVRTLASHQAYYARWARTWEFQALLKARPAAGDLALGAAYVETLAPLVWTAAERDHFVADVQAMRRRVEDTLPPDVAAREIKLGPGGLRDVEFAVQLLQLVHGRADEALRVGGTIAAIEALSAGGYVGRADAATLTSSYHLLRSVEHRLQLQRLRRTHLVPDDSVGDGAGRRWLARAMGFRPDARGGAVAVFDAEWALHAREVRRLHEKLFYRPLLHAVARVPSDQLRLSPEQAARRLEALGFADPDGALRHLSVLTAGVSRRAVIQRTLLPVVLNELADAPDPDARAAGVPDRVRRARRLALVPAVPAGRGPGHRAAGAAARHQPVRGRAAQPGAGGAAHPRRRRRAAAAAGRRAADLVPGRRRAARGPGRGGRRRPGAAPAGAAPDRRRRRARAARHGRGRRGAHRRGRGHGRGGARRRRPYGRAGPRADADPGRGDRDGPGRRRGDRLRLGRRRAVRARPAARGRRAGAASGRERGGRRAAPAARAAGAGPAAAAWTRRCGRRGAAGRWSARSPHTGRTTGGGPRRGRRRRCCGPRRWPATRRWGRRSSSMADPLRYPADGLTPAATTEIRRLKARMDAERLPRGADPATHTKLGRGGLVDVEWTVQLLQLRHGAQVPGLRTTRTLPALAAARNAGLLAADDTAALEAAWRIATRARNAVVLVRGRPSDQLPGRGKDLAGVMRVVGYPPGRDPGQFLDDYRRATRRARAVVERVFYD